MILWRNSPSSPSEAHTTKDSYSLSAPHGPLFTHGKCRHFLGNDMSCEKTLHFMIYLHYKNMSTCDLKISLNLGREDKEDKVHLITRQRLRRSLVVTTEVHSRKEYTSWIN